MIQDNDLPSGWMPLDEIVGPSFRAHLRVPIPDDAFVRVVADASRGGLPYLIYELFWITSPVAHVLRVDEILAPGSDVVADGVLHVVDHERISLEKVEQTVLQLSPTREKLDTIKFTGDSESRNDLPVELIVSYLNDTQNGYGRPGWSSAVDE